jgi:multidrug resistance efflux pump
MNPLIKLDGYYLLSDYLEIPNLRQRSFGYVKVAIKRLLGSTAAALSVTRRERRIYVIYGVLAAVYSYWLLSVFALRFGNHLVEQYQGSGFIAFSGLLMVAFKNPLGRATSDLRASLGRHLGGGPRMKRPAVRAILLGIALVVLFFARMDLKVSGEFNVLPARNADVHGNVDGTIEQVYVEEGDRVRAGDVLVRLSERDYRAELAKTETEIAGKQATLKMLRAGPRKEEIDLARGEIQTAKTRQDHARERYEEAQRIHATRLSRAEVMVKAAQERLQYAQSDLRKFTELFAEGLTSRQLLEQSEEQATLREKELEAADAERLMVLADVSAEVRRDGAVAEKEVAEATARLRFLLAGSRPETIEVTEAEISRLETQRRYLADQLQLTAVVSPVSGVVVTPNLEEKIGERANKGDLILKVFELDRIIPEVIVSEKEIADVKPGQAVIMKARAYPDRRFTGTVKAITPTAIEESALGRKIFRVTIEPDQASDLLKPEMTGTAKISCGKRPIIYLLTRRIARYVRVEFWSWW